MFTPLITKFFAPQVTSSFLKRPQLLDKLELGKQAGFTLVAAPAGYGKSSLVAQWLEATEQAFAWLSLDQDDSDTVQFWQYLIAALEQIDAELGLSSLKALDLHKEDTFQQVIHALINDLVINYRTNNQQLSLVLDDYHRIENPTIHKQLDDFIQKIPANVLHIIVVTRADPPFALAKRRAERQVSEIRAIDLRLDEKESLAFFQKLELSTESETLTLLTQRCEGWFTGLQLAALSLSNKTQVEAFVEKLTGDDRHIADYLIEEVLNHQTQDVKEFLLETAFLERLSADLCDTVRQASDSRNILEKLEQSNVFLISLDNQRKFYRYHHLFADLLRQQAKFAFGDELRTSSLAKASDWSAKHKSWLEAVRYSILIKDTKRTAAYLEQFAYSHSNWRDIRSDWLSAAKEHFDEHPLLYFVKGYCLFNRSYSEETLETINALVDKAEKLELFQENGKLKAHAAILRTLAANFDYIDMDYVTHLKALEKALGEINKEDTLSEAQLCYWLGLLSYRSGNTAKGETWLIRAEDQAKAIKEDSIYLMSAYMRCISLVSARDYKKAKTIAENVLNSASESTLQDPSMGGLYSILGMQKMNQGKFSEAKSLLEEAEELVSLAGDWGMHFNIILILMNAYIVLNQREKGLVVCQRINDSSRITGGVKNIQDKYLRLDKYLENKEVLDTWAQQEQDLFKNLVPASDPQFTWQVFSVALIVKLHIAQRQHGQISNLNEDEVALDSLIESSQSNEAMHPFVARFCLLKCLIYHEKQQPKDAFKAIKLALTYCSLDKGFGWPIFEDREILKPYLEKALEENITPNFVKAVLTIYDELELGSKATEANYGDLEPLSEREIDVLKLIATGLSNKAVAKQLDVSPNTVRAHASNIYSKFAVQGRTEAVARAADIGLL